MDEGLDEVVLELRKLGRIGELLDTLNLRLEALEDAVTAVNNNIAVGLEDVAKAIRGEPRQEL